MSAKGALCFSTGGADRSGGLGLAAGGLAEADLAGADSGVGVAHAILANICVKRERARQGDHRRNAASCACVIMSTAHLQVVWHTHLLFVFPPGL